MQKLLDQQLINSGRRGVVSKLLDYAAYRQAYKNMQRSLHQKGERNTDGTQDPQDHTADSTYDADQWFKVNDHWLKQGTATAARSQSLATLAHHTVGRSDDVRQFHIADVVKPRHYKNIGGCSSTLASWPLLFRRGRAG
jgi:hypothetical protein